MMFLFYLLQSFIEGYEMKFPGKTKRFYSNKKDTNTNNSSGSSGVTLTLRFSPVKGLSSTSSYFFLVVSRYANLFVVELQCCERCMLLFFAVPVVIVVEKVQTTSMFWLVEML